VLDALPWELGFVCRERGARERSFLRFNRSLRFDRTKAHVDEEEKDC